MSKQRNDEPLCATCLESGKRGVEAEHGPEDCPELKSLMSPGGNSLVERVGGISRVPSRQQKRKRRPRY